MTSLEKKKRRPNVEGLRRRAKEKHEAARYKCREAIKLLLRHRKQINFKSVANAANVSASWLYKQQDVRAQIEHLRDQNRPKVPVPKRERASDASKNQMIACYRMRIKNLEEEVSELRAQNERSYALIKDYEQQKRTNR